ncbi:MAG: hypothetical protein J6P73_03890 [Bacteroidales bacterium]|nr:hypothetical protein [Bacteroidales bacterium]
MKRILLLITICLLAFSGFAQKKASYSEDDLKQFYRTIQGAYKGELNDSTNLTIHFVPIWEHEKNLFHWFYLEAFNNETKQIVTQNILEIQPLSNITFNVVVHGLKTPEVFAGQWSNHNFFDGYNTGILKGKKKFVFIKTQDFEYQTGWNKRKSLKCFPQGDRIHFKFVQEDERLYIKRVPKRSSNIIGYTFFKELTD